MKKGLIITVLMLFIISLSGIDARGLTLSEGLKKLSLRARELSIAERNIEMASQDINIANSYRLPQIELYGYQTWLRYQPEAALGLFGPVPLSEKDYLTYGFRINQLLYDFGKTGSLVDASKEALKADKLKRERLKNLLSIRFVNAYFDLLEAQRLIQVSDKKIQALEAHYRNAKALFDAGVVVKNDLLQAEVMLADARQKHIELLNLKKIRISVINNMLSENLNTNVIPEEPILTESFKDITLQQAWQEAIKNRPELKIVDAEIKALRQKLASKKAEYYPTLYASGGYEYQKNRYMVHDDNWMAVLGLKMELFSGGRTRAELKRIKHQLEALEINKQKIADSIRLEVKSAYLSLESARERVQVTRKAIQQAEENLRLQELRYKEAVGTATEVTDAIALLSASKNNYYRALYALKKAEAQLLYAMGIDLLSAYTSTEEVKNEHE